MPKCKICGKPLKESQRKGDYKSCPRCSTIDGKEHVYFPNNFFGCSKKRITKNNPDGIQSHCCEHRPPQKANSAIPPQGIKCSKMK